MSRIATILGRGLAVLLPIAFGVGAVMGAGQLKSAPDAKSNTRPPTPVRVLTLSEMKLVPRVLGYGKVAPVREWRAIARVEGEVTETNPKLAPGEVLPKGAVLLRLDDTDLKLSLAQIDAQLNSLDVKDKTLAASLAILTSQSDVAQREQTRLEGLQRQGAASQTQVDQARRTALSYAAQVLENENQAALNAAERKVLTAQRAISARNLEFTAVRAPYDIRIESVSAELGQVVARNATLVSAEGTDAVDIAAQFPMGRLGPVVRMLKGETVTDLAATVRLTLPGHPVSWEAKVERAGEAINPQTQSASVVVRIKDPLGQAEPGQRPPLRRDMFVEVELSAPARKALIVPADAVQDGTALVVGAGDKLEARKVTVGYRVDGAAVVSEGLKPGDRLVVTDPSIAMPGMVVKPMEDKALKAELAKAAGGSTGE